MPMILAIVAVLVGIIGFGSLSQATMGVGIIGIACLLAVFARMFQAHDADVRRAAALERLETSLLDDMGRARDDRAKQLAATVTRSAE